MKSLLPSLSWSNDYVEAKTKAQEAFLIQSGVQHNVDLARLHLEGEAFRIARKTHTEMVLGGTIYAYKTYKAGRAYIPLGNGDKMYVQTNGAGVELRIP